METTNGKRNWDLAEIQLIYKTTVKASERPKISQSKDAYEGIQEYLG